MKKWFVLLSLLLLISLVAWNIGCGDDDDDSGDDDDDDDTEDDDDSVEDDDDDGDDDDDEDDDEEDDDDDDGCPDPTIDIAICDPANGNFSLTIDNEWFPMEVGTLLVLENDDEKVEIEVLDETEEVAGVTCRVVTETEYEDDELAEISYNWFAQAEDGTICYFGEGVDIYDDGEVVSHAGAWKTGEDGAQAGIIMPADPQVGDAYYQEYYVGHAEDMGYIAGFDEEITTPAGTFTDTMNVRDYDPLSGCGYDPKVYVKGIGIVKDEDLLLTSY